MLGMSYAPASHLDHTIDLVSHLNYATNFVGQLVSKSVIGFVNIHGCVSVSMSMSATGSENARHMNKINSDVLCNGVFFRKR